MAKGVKAIADESAFGRVGVVLEGGYDLEGIESSLLATIEALVGLPGPESVEHAPEAPLAARHETELAHIERTLAPFWKT
jgi:acetoin utilization deacetylase AcuC-like enzyme